MSNPSSGDAALASTSETASGTGKETEGDAVAAAPDGSIATKRSIDPAEANRVRGLQPATSTSRIRTSAARLADWFHAAGAVSLAVDDDSAVRFSLDRGPARTTLRAFPTLVAALRWSILLLGTSVWIVGHKSAPLMVVAIPLLAISCVSWTVWPVRISANRHVPGARLLIDAGLTVAAVVLTNTWQSPVSLIVLVEILVIGFDRGYGWGFGAGAGISFALSVFSYLEPTDTDLTVDATPLLLTIMVTAAMAGYCRGLFIEAHERSAVALGQLDTLSEVNHLLLLLHGLAQTLPAALDVHESLDAARDHLRELFELDTFVVLIRDDSSRVWRVESTTGARLASQYADAALPAPLFAALHYEQAVLESELAPGSGLATRSRSGMYITLNARGRAIGLLGVEHIEPKQYGTREVRILNGIADSLALGIDNANWFRRLRTLGAEEERSRIARDLHDRLAQSLVYITFELDGMIKRRGADAELERLRDDVRRAVTELRETLVQLRSSVVLGRPFGVVARELLERYSERSGIEATLTIEGAAPPLPPRIEQELVRILQEALSNVERHAAAQRVEVQWTLTPTSAVLEIRDDGCGFDPDQAPPRADSFGLLGMRERADAIGAGLRILSRDGTGTRVIIEIDSTQLHR